jgi:protein phosphatase
VGAASLPSDTHRTRNEDAWFVLPERGFFGVFDGMGGHAAAEVAARIAAEEAQDVLLPLAPQTEAEAIADTVRDALFSADAAIRAEAQSRGDPRGMGTTAVMAVLRQRDAEAWSAIIGWAGDSRALLLPSGSRTLQVLTLDDGVVRLHASSLVSARKAQAALGTAVDSRTLSLRERDFFLERHVLLQALGTSLRHVHIGEHALGSGDTLLLVTDGVHDNLTDREIAATTRRGAKAQEIASHLTAAARNRSRDREHLRAKPDDMTAVVLRLGGS